jgi:thiol-disulfide isomerase/thioredoxin
LQIGESVSAFINLQFLFCNLQSFTFGRTGRSAHATDHMKDNTGLLWLLGLTVAVVFVLKSALKVEEPFAPMPLPPLMAAGWINAEGPPAKDDLRGKLVVIDAWATWCGFCVKDLPELTEFSRQTRDDVVLIGLTPEPISEAGTVRDFVADREGMSWPIGYGSQPTLDALNVEGYPTFYLFGRDGMLLWKGHNVSGLEDAVVKALGS